ncbi:MAG: radical SAM protein [Candidatus Omnitrophica bacterium]|nr:radical SAM protein [Candidatus Omnitrophota bacterium]
MLESINLSLSTACGADCLFCPSNRGNRIKQKFMLFELTKRIVDEISSEDFKTQHQIKRIVIGENGDSFLNKDIIEILRYIKFKLPEIKIEVFTNFQNFTKDKAEIMLSERLIDSVYCNVDGSNKRNYFLVKKIDLKTITKNLIDFLEMREKLKNESSLTIAVLTLNSYVKMIYKNFGFYPVKLKDLKTEKIPDDFFIIKRRWEKLLDFRKDKILRSSTCGWAEREKACNYKINYEKYSCPILERIKNEAFIAPDGTWYACCLDSNMELILGNIIADSIGKIYFSDVRANFIGSLEKKEFSKISGPCKTVNCCQALSLHSGLKNILKRLIGPYFSTKIKTLCDKNIYLQSFLEKSASIF